MIHRAIDQYIIHKEFFVSFCLSVDQSTNPDSESTIDSGPKPKIENRGSLREESINLIILKVSNPRLNVVEISIGRGNTASAHQSCLKHGGKLKRE